MKVFAISLVKNEADIIRHNLAIASQWAEKIFVMDNGSEDNTWEIVLAYAKENPKVIPWKKEAKPFRDGIRGEVFREFRHFATDGDWWCFRLDSDEFYIDDPREFLSKVPSQYHVIYSDSVEYQITHEDVAEYQFTGDAAQDIPNLHYHLPTTWSERRFFKHRNKLEWPEGWAVPKHVGVTYPKKIRLRHYQYRSPQQIEARLKTRRQATKDGYPYFGHTNQERWEEKLFYRKDLAKDEQNGQFQLTGCRNNHLPGWRDDLVKKLLHGIGIYH